MIALPVPEEPTALRRRVRTLLESSPTEAEELLRSANWIADPLWDAWRQPLECRGMARECFRHLVAAYRNELRLWVIGERPWDHCIDGLIGRVSRRV